MSHTHHSFGFGSFLWRWLFALALVLGTYNPTEYSFIGWTLSPDMAFGPVIAIVALVLLILWIIYLRATFMSLGMIGIGLGAALLACFIWLFIDLGWVTLDSPGTLSWVALILVSVLLAVGMSWSHVRKRLTGQIDVDDVED